MKRALFSIPEGKREAGLDDVLTLAGVWAFRQEGWRWAEWLAASSPQPEALARLRARLDRRACVYGRLLYRPGWAGRTLTAAWLHQLERGGAAPMPHRPGLKEPQD